MSQSAADEALSMQVDVAVTLAVYFGPAPAKCKARRAVSFSTIAPSIDDLPLPPALEPSTPFLCSARWVAEEAFRRAFEAATAGRLVPAPADRLLGVDLIIDSGTAAVMLPAEELADRADAMLTQLHQVLVKQYRLLFVLVVGEAPWPDALDALRAQLAGPADAVRIKLLLAPTYCLDCAGG